jgi:hypothetical protein
MSRHAPDEVNTNEKK